MAALYVAGGLPSLALAGYLVATPAMDGAASVRLQAICRALGTPLHVARRCVGMVVLGWLIP